MNVAGRRADGLHQTTGRHADRACHATSSHLEGRQHFVLDGLVIAIVTPFFPGNLRLDEASLKAYLQFLWDAGVKNIVVNGTTGEFSSMSLEERMHVTDLARKHWPGVIVNNVSATSHLDTIKLLQHSQECEGRDVKVEAALLLPPYYFASATEEGLERWLRLVLESAHQPVYLYNFPQHTGNFISPQLYKRLGQDFPMLRGIKNTFDDVPLAVEFKEALPDRQVYIGSDMTAKKASDAGLDGNVSSGGGSAILKAVVDFAAAGQSGAVEHLAAPFAAIERWTRHRESLGILDIPACKAALSAVVQGFNATVRPPLLQVTPQQSSDLLQLLNGQKEF